MHFEVNGIRYFLGFDEQHSQWQLLTPTRKGITRMNVVNDDSTLPFFDSVVFNDEEEVDDKPVN